jgi:hypothetical protein
MNRKQLFNIINKNSGTTIEESSKNGIIANKVDVDALIDDILELNNSKDKVCEVCSKPTMDVKLYQTWKCFECFDSEIN